jgi:flagellar basal body-associated protein FliL
MTEQNDNNKRKSKLIMFMLIAIIAVLFAGIVYQFIVIKKLQKQVENNPSAYVCVVENESTSEFLKYKNF